MGNTIPIKVFAKYAFQKYIYSSKMLLQKDVMKNVIFVNNYTNL